MMNEQETLAREKIFETFSVDASQPCAKPNSLPLELKELAANLYEGNIIVTGGAKGTNPTSNTYILQNGVRTTGPQMKDHRSYHAAVVTANGLWALGGRNNFGQRLDSTEFYTNGAWATSNIKLPEPLLGFCAVALDEER